MTDDVLVVEISGKRPGDVKNRPTEKYKTKRKHLIISNNSEGYETKWEIVNVPDDYKQYYIEHHKMSESAWYAPMNRSYAIKYAKEHGYRYLVQLDDNIVVLELSYVVEENGVIKRYRTHNTPEMMDDYIDMMLCVAQNTDAGMVGCRLVSFAPSDAFLSEAYCYSFFLLDLERCPDIFHGDFEDDIDFRLKLTEMGVPTVQIQPLKYGKTGQKSSKDETGNRAAYTAAGLLRGEHMSILHGDVYSCGYSSKTASTRAQKSGRNFKHKIKPIKIGVKCKNRSEIDKKMSEIFKKNATHHDDKYIRKERKKNESGRVEK